MKAWDLTLPFAPVYYSKATGAESITLAGLCAQEKKLALAKGGFQEIGIRRMGEVIPGRWQHLTTVLPKDDEATLESVTDDLLARLKRYFVKAWQSDRFHLMWCSAGLDSRILAWVLADLRDERGRDWLGDIHFVCHHPEGGLFKQTMKTMGWREDEYSVHRESQPQNADYYDLGRFEDNANAWCRMTLRFWDDVVPLEREAETVLVCGACGGELLHYPIWRSGKRGILSNRFDDLHRHMPWPHHNFARLYSNWGDVLLPFLAYDYLDAVFRLPAHLFKRQWSKGPDKIRWAMLQRFGDGVKLYTGHRYDFTMSPKRKRYIKDCWRGSKLYRDFKHIPWVESARPWSGGLNTLDAKLYSYATMYERA